MKEFPVFTTEYGVASLTMKQIPYRGEAYIQVQDSAPGQREALIRECADFCRAAGAEKILVTPAEGEPDIRILEMRGVPSLDFEEVQNIFPVTEETVSRWREIANQRLRLVDLAAMLEKKDEQRILSSGGAYFIHSQGTLLGIGWLEGEELKLLASVVPGAGYQVAQTLLSVQPGQSIRLEVASTNGKAIRLYERLGFLPVAELETWQELKTADSGVSDEA